MAGILREWRRYVTPRRVRETESSTKQHNSQRNAIVRVHFSFSYEIEGKDRSDDVTTASSPSQSRRFPLPSLFDCQTGTSEHRRTARSHWVPWGSRSTLLFLRLLSTLLLRQRTRPLPWQWTWHGGRGKICTPRRNDIRCWGPDAWPNRDTDSQAGTALDRIWRWEEPVGPLLVFHWTVDRSVPQMLDLAVGPGNWTGSLILATLHLASLSTTVCSLPPDKTPRIWAKGPSRISFPVRGTEKRIGEMVVVCSPSRRSSMVQTQHELTTSHAAASCFDRPVSV